MSRACLCFGLILSVSALPVSSQTLRSPLQFRTAALFAPLAVAEEQAPQPLAQTGTAATLNLIVIEGEGAINNIKQRTAREVIVEVDDQNHKPVGGVLLTFFAANEGGAPGGTFANGSHLVTVVTDASGRATARNFQPNAVEGSFVIEVTASYLDAVVGKTFVHQSNSLTAAGTGTTAGTTAGTSTGAAATHGLSHAMVITIAAVSVAAAVGLAVGLTRGGGSTATAGTVGIGAGTATVGAPQ